MNKIGWVQFSAVLVISRIFSEATTIPSSNIVYGMQRYSVILLSFILTFIAYIPLFLIAGKNNGKCFLELAYERSKAAAIAFGIVYIIFLLYLMTETTVRLDYYATSTIFDAAPAIILLLFVVTACIYGTVKGIEAVTRTGIIISAGFFLLLFLVTIAVMPIIETEYIYPAFLDRPEEFLSEVIAEFSRNSEAVIFAVLCRRIRKDADKTIILYLSLTCGILLLMTFLYNTVLGEYLNEVNFPFYTLSSVSDISVLQRLNGLDVVIWLMAAIIKLSLFAIAIREIFMIVSGKAALSLWAGIIAPVITAVIAYFIIGAAELFKFMINIRETGIPTALTVGILPLTAIIMGKRRRRNGED